VSPSPLAGLASGGAWSSARAPRKVLRPSDRPRQRLHRLGPDCEGSLPARTAARKFLGHDKTSVRHAGKLLPISQHAKQETILSVPASRSLTSPAHDGEFPGEKRWNVAVTSIRAPFRREANDESDVLSGHCFHSGADESLAVERVSEQLQALSGGGAVGRRSFYAEQYDEEDIRP